MNYGLVGNTIFFGGAAMMFGYLCIKTLIYNFRIIYNNI